MIISEKRTYSYGRVSGRTSFEMVSDHEPTEAEVMGAQIRMGYNPGGYGGPWGRKTEKKGDNYVTTWYCAGSCD